MRVLLASDLHYDLRKLDWLLQATGDVDLLALAGDLLDVSSSVPLEGQIEAVRAYLGRMGSRATVAVCSGNHDLDHRGEHGEKATRWLGARSLDGVHVDGDSFMLGEDLVSVLAWWEGPVTRAALEAQLERDADRPRRRWLWLYHSPPEGALSWTGSRHFGDDVVSGWIERFAPDLVMCGHIHQAPFTGDGSWHEQRGSTLLLNAGHQMGAEPSHVVVDLDDLTASWTSQVGAEQLMFRAV